MKASLAQRLSQEGYDGYAYAYPHKTAYRPLDPPVPLAEAWKTEDKRRILLYVHLPFCEMRCGFCNLFTTVQPGVSLVDQTLAAIHRQSEIVAREIQAEGVAQAAFGGGTPSFLTESQLEALFRKLDQDWPIPWDRIPISFEVSPGTVTASKLALLRSRGVDRISLGVQSFVPEDLVALKRPQPKGELAMACELIRNAGFKVFNIDLIYGATGQDATRWQSSLEQALAWRPEEIYLYPLYVGKLTHLDRSGRRPGDDRRERYRQARDFLVGSGYRQISMRLFRRSEVRRDSEHCCQEDGMVGLGPGARSYTRGLHYSTEYAVGQGGVRLIIENFNQRTQADFAEADYGAVLDQTEQKRRFVIKSLLRSEGVSPASYRRLFGSYLDADFPELGELSRMELAENDGHTWRLTSSGLEASDTIGPWLYSPETEERMAAYQLT